MQDPACVSDLHPHHKEHRYVKFAEDTYLLILSNMRHMVCEELDGVKKWTESNNLKLNTDKSKKMLVKKVEDGQFQNHHRSE